MEQNVNEETAMRYAVASSFMQDAVKQAADAALVAAPAACAALHFLVKGKNVKVDPTSHLQRVVNKTAVAEDPTIHSLDSVEEVEEPAVDEPFNAPEILEYFETRLEQGESAQYRHALAVDSSGPLELAHMTGLGQVRLDEALAAQNAEVVLYATASH
jgi:hypothetical protein